MRLRSSLAIRITAALVAVTFVATASLLGGIYYFSVKVPIDRVRTDVAAEARALATIFERQGAAGLKAALLKRRQAPSPNKAFDAFLDRRGKPLTANLPSWPVVRRGVWVTIEADLYRDGDEDDHEALTHDAVLPDGHRLLVGRDVEVLADREEMMVEASRWGLLSVLLFGLVGGIAISWLTARRLDAVVRTARSVMQGDFNTRVPVRGNGDEFDQLGMSLNAMLDRNQELMASLGRVSDNIAHELRTPLARVRTILEASESLDKRQVETVRRDLDRLQQTFDALLRIARIDTGRHRLNAGPVQLDALVTDAVELYEAEADSRRQKLSLTVVPCIVSGDRNLLFQAVGNLLDNAIKFTPEGGDVRVDFGVEGAFARLLIVDSGPGVDSQHHDRLAERFFRAPGSEQIAGTGLGLTLVDAIASAHHGSLSFAGEAGEFRVVLSLPTSN